MCAINDMSGQTRLLAIISGGTGYLGTAIIAELKAAGWNVISLSKNISKSSEDVYKCNVSNEKDVHAVISEIIAAHGTISACIHAASPPLERVPILSISPESFNNSINTNVKGAFLLAKEMSKYMPKNSVFIGITTHAIEQNVPLHPSGAYVPAKYALRGFLRVLSAETRQTGLRVYAISPNFLPGGLNDDLPRNVQDFFAEKNGTGKDSPKEIAVLVKKLCTGETEFPPGSSIAFPSLTASSL